MRQIWDISPAVSAKTPVFPGDTPFQILWNERINDDGVANISTLHMSPHCGAHVDAPMHLDSRAPGVSELRLATFIGKCRLIDVSGGTGAVQPEEVAQAAGYERVLLKTRTAQPDTWTNDFRSVSPAAMRALIDGGVVLVGLDTPSVDPADSELLPSHRIALANGMAVIENLTLTEAAAGEYELIALPLNLVGVEASPVRAVLRRINR